MTNTALGAPETTHVRTAASCVIADNVHACQRPARIRSIVEFDPLAQGGARPFFRELYRGSKPKAVDFPAWHSVMQSAGAQYPGWLTVIK